MNNWKQNKTWCAYPWMHQVVQTRGRYSPCCVASPSSVTKDGKDMMVTDFTFEEARNSEFMRNLRKNMVEGHHNEICNHCYREEELNKLSYRLRNNQTWLNSMHGDLEECVEKSITNNYIVEKNPIYLDLRLGNLCNLQCRSCSPWNSSQIQKETIELLEKDDVFAAFWNTVYSNAPQEMTPWYESDKFWDELKQMTPSLQKVYMTGGEPTLIKKNYEFMQYMIDNKYTNVELFFNLNCTNIQGDFLTLIEQFPNVAINLSIDGYEKLQEYIRYPSKWDKINSNFLALLKYPNINLGITPVLQAYNVLGITKLLEYIDSVEESTNRKIHIDILINHLPYHNSPLVIPFNIRQEAAERLQEFVNISIICAKNAFSKNSILAAIKFLLTETTKKYEIEYRDHFITYTQSLDKNRDSHLFSNEPELWERLNAAGIKI